MILRLVVTDVSEITSDRLDVHIAPRCVYYIPVQFVACIKSLSMSLRRASDDNSEYANWSSAVNISELIGNTCPVNFENEMFFLSATSLQLINTMTVTANYDVKSLLFDHTIDIIAGVNVINALPYAIEIKTRIPADFSLNQYSRSSTGELAEINGDVSIKSKGLKNAVYIVYPGSKYLLPINYNKLAKVNIRISSNPQESFRKSPDNSILWSESLDLRHIFSKDSHDAETLYKKYLPCIGFAGSSSNVKCSILLSKQSVNDALSDTNSPAAPTMLIYADIWVQNNSTIPLKYKFYRYFHVLISLKYFLK